MPEERFRRHDDQRSAKIPLHLSPQGMKVLGRRRQVADLDVVLGAEREIAFETGIGVLRALTFITVGQQHDDAAARCHLSSAGR